MTAGERGTLPQPRPPTDREDSPWVNSYNGDIRAGSTRKKGRPERCAGDRHRVTLVPTVLRGNEKKPSPIFQTRPNAPPSLGTRAHTIEHQLRKPGWSALVSRRGCLRLLGGRGSAAGPGRRHHSASPSWATAPSPRSRPRRRLAEAIEAHPGSTSRARPGARHRPLAARRRRRPGARRRRHRPAHRPADGRPADAGAGDQPRPARVPRRPDPRRVPRPARRPGRAGATRSKT